MAAYPFRPCPMSNPLTAHYAATLDEIRAQGLFKSERIITGPQSAEIALEDGRTVLNFCANNYLGLADHPDIIQAAKDALDTHGFGMASVRFICGTQDLHKQLEKTIADFFGTEDTILYAACFDANGGLFEPLLGEDDAIISDALNHASIIDGVRLCKAKRFRYANCDMADLETQLQAADAAGCRTKLITTDGVFSMDGFIAPLDEITALAKEYNALVHIDECHATGFLGATGRGSAEVKGVMDRIDIFTGTLGKAMGGALGGFTTARKEVVELLRQRSRPYLFSNSLPPHVVAAGIKAFEMLSSAGDLRERLRENTAYFRERMTAAGFDIKPGVHPISPVMLYDAPLAQRFAERLLQEGIYAIGFFFPVVPKGQARIRTQMSAAHTREHLDRAIEAFIRIGSELGVLKASPAGRARASRGAPGGGRRFRPRRCTLGYADAARLHPGVELFGRHLAAVLLHVEAMAMRPWCDGDDGILGRAPGGGARRMAGAPRQQAERKQQGATRRQARDQIRHVIPLVSAPNECRQMPRTEPGRWSRNQRPPVGASASRSCASSRRQAPLASVPSSMVPIATRTSRSTRTSNSSSRRRICRLRPSSSTISSHALRSPARSSRASRAERRSPSTSTPFRSASSKQASGTRSTWT